MTKLASLILKILLFTQLILVVGCEQNEPPKCEIVNPHEGDKFPRGQLVTVTANAEDKDGTLSDVRINVDGKDVSNASKALAGAQPSEFQLVYHWNTSDSEYGDHILRATTVDNEGLTITDEIVVSIYSNPPIADFSAKNTLLIIGVTGASFTDLTTNTPTSWNWDFGDGSSSIQQNPSKGYDSAGIYTVSLTSTNASGSDTETKTDFITVSEAGGFNPYLPYGTVTDFEGTVYQTIQIGNQIWMAENLKTTHYTSGSSIPLIENDSTWGDFEIDDKAYCWHWNSLTNRDTYGVLYTWAAAMNGSSSSSENPSGIQGICPEGWHLPSDEEWKELELYLGMSETEANSTGIRGTYEGSALKETGYDHWVYHPQYGWATNSSGFTALPGGFRREDGSFWGLNYGGEFWTTSESGTAAWTHGLAHSITGVTRYNNYYKREGLSVRCVED